MKGWESFGKEDGVDIRASDGTTTCLDVSCHSKVTESQSVGSGLYVPTCFRHTRTCSNHNHGFHQDCHFNWKNSVQILISSTVASF